MKLTERIIEGSKGLREAVFRFPAATVFLISTAVINSMIINNYNYDYDKYVMISVIGVFIMVMTQMLSEHYQDKRRRIIFHAIALVFLIIWYFLVIRNGLDEVASVRSIVLMFALTFAFLWIPSLKQDFEFNKTFMAGFKAFFIAIFFSAVMMLGFLLVYQAIDVLLFDVNEDIFAHTANIVFVIFGILYFLSLIPDYNKYRGTIKSEIDQAVSSPRFLTILISYIIIPLASVFTLILLVYIVLNISGSFWKDDLLEVMLVSYIVVLIVIYILSSRIDNSIVKLFRMIFPKVLLIIVIFQTVNSVLRISDYGLTYGRYFVILFGVFAFISSLIFIFRKVSDNGYVAVVLIVFMLISITYPVDAFSISKRSQINFLTDTLEEAGMLVDGEIVPNADLDKDNKSKIITSSRYLERMGYTEELEFLSDDFDYYKDFYTVYGFPYSNYDRVDNYYFTLDEYQALDISGYDIMLNINFNFNENYDNRYQEYLIEYDGSTYEVIMSEENNDLKISVSDVDKTLIEIYGLEFADKYDDGIISDYMMTAEEASFDKSNENVEIKLIFNYIDVYDLEVERRYSGSAYLLIKVKQ